LRDDPIATAPGSDTWPADTAFCKYSDQKNNYSAREASGRDCDCNHVRIVNPLSPASESVGKLVSVVLCVTSVPLWWIVFQGISPQRHRASQSFAQRNAFSDRLLRGLA